MNMDNKEIIQKLENAPDLKTNINRLKDYIEMGQNIFLTENNFAEGKRVCEYGRNIALFQTARNPKFYDIYLLSLKYLARYFRDFDSYMIFMEYKRSAESQFYLPRREILKNKLGVIQGFQDILDDKLDILTVSLPCGTGKGQRENAKILTPKGFKRFGDIQVGDKIISGMGNVAEILGIFPKPSMPIYEVTFDDGSKVQCSQDHIWHVQTMDDRNNKKEKNKYRDIELKDMLKNYKVGKRKQSNYSVDYVPVIDCFDEKELKIAPYLMGVLLGDGGFTSNSISVTLVDEEIKQEVIKLLPENLELHHQINSDYRIVLKKNSKQYKNNLKEILKEYELIEKYSYEKHIPKEYLYSSYRDRLDLLRGILDTDGFAETTGVEYSTSSKQLAEDVRELVHSLGGYCSYRIKENCGYKKDGKFIKCRPSYRLRIQFSSEQPNPFKLSRKANVYNPKRKILKRYITNIEYVGEEKTSCIYISDPSHLYITDDYIITHNTTISEFFLSYFMGMYPDMFNLYVSYTGTITDMFHRSICDILFNDEYAWREVFPNVGLESKSDKEKYINLGSFKPFKSLTCRSIDASMTGATRANGIILSDDLVSGTEEALNVNRLETLYQKYINDAKSRRIKGCKEISIATRWSVHDPIGHFIVENEENPRARFIAISCFDKNGESNFDYKFDKGFDTKYFKEMQNVMDEITFRCMYLSDPIEREGLLYHEDDFEYYLNLPVNEKGERKEADAILGVCDTKDTGTDYNCLLIGYKYGEKYYLEDIVYDNGSPYVLDELNSDCLVRNNTQMCQFESNKEGSRTGNEVQKLVAQKGGRCSITKKYSTANKETKIIVNSDWVKKHVVIKDKSLWNDMYKKFMKSVFSYVQMGKNKHDDSVDALAMFALFVQSLEGTKVVIMDRAKLGF